MKQNSNARLTCFGANLRRERESSSCCVHCGVTEDEGLASVRVFCERQLWAFVACVIDDGL